MSNPVQYPTLEQLEELRTQAMMQIVSVQQTLDVYLSEIRRLSMENHQAKVQNQIKAANAPSEETIAQIKATRDQIMQSRESLDPSAGKSPEEIAQMLNQTGEQLKAVSRRNLALALNGPTGILAKYISGQIMTGARGSIRPLTSYIGRDGQTKQVLYFANGKTHFKFDPKSLNGLYHQTESHGADIAFYSNDKKQLSVLFFIRGFDTVISYQNISDTHAPAEFYDIDGTISGPSQLVLDAFEDVLRSACGLTKINTDEVPGYYAPATSASQDVQVSDQQESASDFGQIQL